MLVHHVSAELYVTVSKHAGACLFVSVCIYLWYVFYVIVVCRTTTCALSGVRFCVTVCVCVVFSFLSEVRAVAKKLIEAFRALRM
jgi:hypothetical protein